MSVTSDDLTQLGDICATICYHLTAHLARVAAGVMHGGPPEVATIYQLAQKLLKVEAAQWSGLQGKPEGKAGKATKAAAQPEHPASAGAKEPGKRIKWTEEMTQELVKLVQDEDYRTLQLGKEGTRGANINWAAIARHYGYANGSIMQKKYSEVTGVQLEKRPRGPNKKDDGKDSEQPAAKKAKQAGGAPAPAASTQASPAKAAKAVPPSQRSEVTAAAAAPAAAAPTPATGASTPGGGEEAWTKKQDEELLELVDSQEKRKTLFGKRKLRWKKIGEHFGRKSKACRKHYSKLTGKEAPEDED